MSQHGSEAGTPGSTPKGPKRDEAATGEGGDRQDAQVPSGGPIEGGADPRDVAEGEATRGGYG
jgi:hypothetical protein